jgi:hypothetical protein
MRSIGHARVAAVRAVAVAAFAASLAACSNDAPGGVDANACTCPAAEPPLAERIVRLPSSSEIEPMGIGVAGRSCPTGAIVLGGSCRLRSPLRGIYLLDSGVSDGAPGWVCIWESNSGLPATGLAEVICLLPPP